jgi:hypothetical protein
MSQMFEMRLTKEQADWVVHMDEIQENVEKEINDLQRLALRLAEHIGGVRSDIGFLTERPIFAMIPEYDADDAFTKKLVQRLNGLS